MTSFVNPILLPHIYKEIRRRVTMSSHIHKKLPLNNIMLPPINAVTICHHRLYSFWNSWSWNIHAQAPHTHAGTDQSWISYRDPALTRCRPHLLSNFHLHRTWSFVISRPWPNNAERFSSWIVVDLDPEHSQWMPHRHRRSVASKMTLQHLLWICSFYACSSCTLDETQ